jgi:hypothetical protein
MAASYGATVDTAFVGYTLRDISPIRRPSLMIISKKKAKGICGANFLT